MRSQNFLMSQDWCFWEAPLLISCILCGENALNIERAFWLSTEDGHGCPGRHLKESGARGDCWPAPVGRAVGSGWSGHYLLISFIYIKQKPNRNRINLHLRAHRSITSFSVLSYYNLVCLGPGKKQKSFQTLSFAPIPFFLCNNKT